MPNTPVQGLPYPALSDPANGPVAFQNLATALEDYKTIVRCTSTTRPAHVEGRICYETDTERVIVSDGATWRQIKSKNDGVGTYGPNMVNLSCTLNIARYTIVNGICEVWKVFTVNAAGGGQIWTPTPVPISTGAATPLLVCGHIHAIRQGVSYYTGYAVPRDVNNMTFCTADHTVWSGTYPASWQVGDSLGIHYSFPTDY